MFIDLIHLDYCQCLLVYWTPDLFLAEVCLIIVLVIIVVRRSLSVCLSDHYSHHIISICFYSFLSYEVPLSDWHYLAIGVSQIYEIISSVCVLSMVVIWSVLYKELN